ncbi:SRPBCC family protein [Dinghuibacter silviterrae]|uniref:Uncharacterized protein YndB with AHSA1/START domain n=1 Tax=Dinghuibacter silviterrae TaxID=1539049 RepID=A0A4R8DRE7_9BACT|nr:SRPBCC domain-containing protein [Dinghuibacter silviterrae]TDW99916.1 uncharacterized protein YndB with AHSA1/START domain [Dinghuibacter silviterrae]
MSRSIVHIDTHLNFPAAHVWRAWTDPAMILQWFGSDPEGTGVSANLDVRPGGAYEISFRDSDGTVHTCFGTYEAVEPNNLLSFTWTWASEPHQPSLVTVRLTPDGAGTMMAFTHAGVWSNSEHAYKEGWTRTFTKLERTLVTGSISA